MILQRQAYQILNQLQEMANNCYHKLKYLSYSEKCRQPAGICENKCNQKMHGPQQHFYKEIEQFVEDVKLHQKSSHLNLEGYIEKMEGIIDASINEFKLIKEQYRDRITKQIQKLQLEKNKHEETKLKIINQRYQFLNCSEIYKFQLRINQKIQTQLDKKLNKIIEELQKLLENKAPKPKIKKTNSTQKELQSQLHHYKQSYQLLSSFLNQSKEGEVNKQAFEKFQHNSQIQKLKKQNQQLLVSNGCLKVKIKLLQNIIQKQRSIKQKSQTKQQIQQNLPNKNNSTPNNKQQ